MARTSTNKTTTNKTKDSGVAAKATSETSVKDAVVNEESTTDEVKENESANEVVEEQKELTDMDEIDVVSLVKNVSYEDKNTGDFYEWENVGDVQILTFATLKNMWRNHKKYFRNFVLKPKDKRVIEKFGLTSYYKQYDLIIDSSKYTADNLKKIIDIYNKSNNDIKVAIERQIRGFVSSGKLSDVKIIKQLQSGLGFDLISYI